MRKSVTTFHPVICDGAVIDGTGAPECEADVAVIDGKVASLGKVMGREAEEIDAQGELVRPGFADLHAHYDVQVVWGKHTALPS